MHVYSASYQALLYLNWEIRSAVRLHYLVVRLTTLKIKNTKGLIKKTKENFAAVLLANIKLDNNCGFILRVEAIMFPMFCMKKKRTQ